MHSLSIISYIVALSWSHIVYAVHVALFAVAPQQQLLHGLYLPTQRGTLQRSEAALIARVDSRAARQQRHHYFRVTLVGGRNQCRVPQLSILNNRVVVGVANNIVHSTGRRA